MSESNMLKLIALSVARLRGTTREGLRDFDILID